MALNTRQQGSRLPPEIFDLPVEKMREGYYTDAYFNHTRSALLADERHPRVVMQVFQKHEAVLGGMDEAIAVLKLCSDDWDALRGASALFARKFDEGVDAAILDRIDRELLRS